MATPGQLRTLPSRLLSLRRRALVSAAALLADEYPISALPRESFVDVSAPVVDHVLLRLRATVWKIVECLQTKQLLPP